MAILITRPDVRGQALVEALKQLGLVALHEPLLQIEAGRELAQLPKLLSQLNAGDLVFAVSRHAVTYAAQTLQNIGFRWRDDLTYLAVGHRSAGYFCEQSANAVRYPLASENSEALLDLPELQQLQDKQILLLRGNGGREYFAEQAQARGAHVYPLECYQRLTAALDFDVQSQLWQRFGVDTLVVSSLQILQILNQAIPEDKKTWLLNCTLVTVSERIATAARHFGFTHVVVATGADNASLLTTLTQLTSLPSVRN